MKSKKDYTIKDIANMAQVSRATVDRVIHNRGFVSRETSEKIQLIIDKVGYQPNFMAKILQKRKLFRIGVLIPDGDFDQYWEKAINAIKKTAHELSFIGLSLDLHLFDPFKEISFSIHSKQILQGEYGGVIVTPIFNNEASLFFIECASIGLPCVSFNSFTNDTNILCHVDRILRKVVGPLPICLKNYRVRMMNM
ncbi:LacI family DNA-binding transcriptional regulator [Carboxylicivirga sp. N1Y90]|uniref:LacI family DNA-binding transcriptional regulator n=1 Tax=Carboxylicivirga fragile TaxID=3417571 RepID=UPI003D356533|nr:LacI family DNA-binding transcriptional regulator [Marinilabiliaceae bacterium N1Y90]